MSDIIIEEKKPKLQQLKEFLCPATNNYLLNTITYKQLKFKEFKLYRKHKLLGLFDITVLCDEASSLNNGEFKSQKWIFDASGQIEIKNYLKN